MNITPTNEIKSGVIPPSVPSSKKINPNFMAKAPKGGEECCGTKTKKATHGETKTLNVIA